MRFASILSLLQAFHRLGLLSDDTVEVKGTLLETLAHTMCQKMSYKDGERDMIMLQHTFVLEKPSGFQVCRVVCFR